jgi:hypothetical protein
MNWIKKNMIWIVVGFLVYKYWDKIGPMLGIKPKDQDTTASVSAVDDSEFEGIEA